MLLGVLDLLLQLLDDEAGAPLRGLPVADDVAVDVVADVEDALAGEAGEPLEVEEVAALVDLAALERLCRRLGHLSCVIQLDERPVLGEEGGLLRADHDVIEVIAPRRILRQSPVEEEPHHRIGVVPQ